LINPIIMRHARSQFRIERTGPIVVLAAYLIVLVLAFAVNYVIGSHYNVPWSQSLRNYWYEILAVQMFVLVLAASIRVSGSIVKEREQKRFDFQLVTGMSSWRIAEGEMFGSALFSYFLILCSLPFAVLCVIGGGVSWELLGISYLMLFTSAFFFQAWGLFASTVCRTYAAAIVTTLVLVALLGGAVLLYRHQSGLLPGFAAISPFYLIASRPATAAEIGRIGFLDQEFSEVFAVSAAYFFLGFWTLNAAARRIRRPQAPYFSKFQALVFAAFVLAAIAGLLVARTSADDQPSLFYENTGIYLSSSILLMLVFSFVLSPRADSYLDMKKRGTGGVVYAVLGEHSLFFPAMLKMAAMSIAIYFGILVLLSQGVPNLTHAVGGSMPLEHLLKGFAFLLLAGLFYTILVQVCILLSRRIGRELAAFILLVLILLPVLPEFWGKLPTSEYLHLFDPSTVLFAILPTGLADHAGDLASAALLLHLILCIALGLLLFLRIRALTPRAVPPSPPGPEEPAAPEAATPVPVLETVAPQAPPLAPPEDES
jgi:hypothetical protein